MINRRLVQPPAVVLLLTSLWEGGIVDASFLPSPSRRSLLQGRSSNRPGLTSIANGCPRMTAVSVANDRSTEDFQVRQSQYPQRGRRGSAQGTLKIAGENIFRAFDPSLSVDMEAREEVLSRVEHEKVLTSILSSWAKSNYDDAADRCYAVLQYLKSDRHQRLEANRFLYGVCINAYAKRLQPEKCEALLEEMMEQGYRDPKAYTALITSYAKGGGRNGPNNCLRILNIMKEQPGLTPTDLTYQLVLQSLTKWGRGEQAEALITEMIDEANLVPDAVAFRTVMNALSKSLKIENAPQRCEQLLARMAKLADEGAPDLEPDTNCYNIVLDAYTRRKQPRRAEEILDKMMQQGRMVPDLFSFTAVLKAWALSNEQDAPDQCERILLDLSDFAEGLGRKDLRPDTQAYQAVIQAYGRRTRPQEAEGVLRRMQNAGLADIIAFTTVLDAWSKSRARDAPEQCKRILEELQEMAKTDKSLKPDAVLYSAVIDAYSRRGRAREAEELFRVMSADPDIGPTRISYRVVLNGWAKSDAKDADVRCRQLLNEMKELSEKLQRVDLLPTTADYNIAMSWFAKRGRANEAEDLLKKMVKEEKMSPSVVSYSTVLNAYAKSPTTDAPDQCERLLSEMSQMAEELGDKDLMPNVFSYTAALNAYARRGRAAEAQLLFRKILEEGKVSPNVATFSALIDAWAKSDDDNGPSQCVKVLSEMQKMAREKGDSDLEPDAAMFVTILSSFVKRRLPQEAEDTLRKWIDEGYVRPRSILFNTVMDAWAKSDAEDGPEQCLRLLNEMDELAKKEPEKYDLRPTTFTHTIVINSFGRRGRVEEAEEHLMTRLGDDWRLNRYDIALSAAMSAWGKYSTAPDAGGRCKRLWDEVRQSGRDPGAVVNKIVVDAYISRGKVAEAESFVKEMIMDEAIPIGSIPVEMLLRAYERTENATETRDRIISELMDAAKLAGKKELTRLQLTS